MGGGGAQVMKRIPRIKFPQRRPPTPSAAGSLPQNQAAAGEAQHVSIARSDVPAPPTNMAVGGKASLQPKRTPVSDKEIEAILDCGKQLPESKPASQLLAVGWLLLILRLLKFLEMAYNASAAITFLQYTK